MAAVEKRTLENGVELPGDGAVRERAGKFYDEGYNCAEVLVRVYAEFGLIRDADAATLEMVSTGFGKGMGKTLGSCGALTGAIMVLNATFAPRLEKRKWIYKIAGQFTQIFQDRFSYTTCNALRKHRDVDCRELTCETAVMLNQFLLRRLPG